MDGQIGTRKFDVGGVLLNQPFKLRRLGHFGLYVRDMEACLRLYIDLLGFRVTDVLDFKDVVKDPKLLDGLPHTKSYFTSHCGDHHSFVLMNRHVYERRAETAKLWPEVTINQISWQVSSLKEVADAADWFTELGLRINRTGRDMPGSNWHTYPYDAEGHKHELYYGMEQIGWMGRSKPGAMHDREFREKPGLPQISEAAEVEQTMARGVDMQSGYRYSNTLPAEYDVDGILLPRPFKIVRHGPVRLFIEDMDDAVRYYTEILGFDITEEVAWNGHRCVFLRCNLEHHSLALYPIALRAELGLDPGTTLFSFGIQLGNYRQLRDAVGFLGDNGYETFELPAELFPGIDYSAFVTDPEGHAIQLYYYMEQVGWDGQPRPAELRREIAPGAWPEALEPLSDTYTGEPFLGPLG